MNLVEVKRSAILFSQIGEDSAHCRKCGGKMSAYFCAICKHFTSIDKNPYHCDKCGICRWVKHYFFVSKIMITRIVDTTAAPAPYIVGQ